MERKYIRYDLAIKAVKEVFFAELEKKTIDRPDTVDLGVSVMDALGALPAEEVAPRVPPHWIPEGSYWKCSVCGYYEPFGPTKFCGGCGERMHRAEEGPEDVEE